MGRRVAALLQGAAVKLPMRNDANPLNVPISVMRYDVTLPLLDGRVTADGVRLAPAKTSSMVIRDIPELRGGDFGLWDLNVGFWLPAIEAGWDLVALPVFPKRKSALQFIFCRSDAHIHTPRDLAGKRVGTRQYRTAVTLWVRGLLKDHYDVDVSAIRWFVQVKDVFPLHDQGAHITYVDDKRSMVDALLAGEVDAIVTDLSDAGLFERLETDPAVVRLFPEYPTTDLALYRETGIYPPMHVLVMSGRLDRESPGLARRLYDACEKAKATAYDEIAGDRAGFSVVYLRERFKEQQALWGDPCAYGIQANRAMIDTFLRYNREQGAIESPLPYERIFAAGVLDT
jgi:4,5-dihydroxyphthalate decarboxylase